MKNSLLIIIILISSCQNTKNETPVSADEVSIKKERPLALDSGKFFEVEGRKMLYGGPDSSQHFDITGYDLNDAIEIGEGTHAIGDILIRLSEYTKMHFTYEEQLFEKHKCKQCLSMYFWPFWNHPTCVKKREIFPSFFTPQ